MTDQVVYLLWNFADDEPLFAAGTYAYTDKRDAEEALAKLHYRHGQGTFARDWVAVVDSPQVSRRINEIFGHQLPLFPELSKTKISEGWDYVAVFHE